MPSPSSAPAPPDRREWIVDALSRARAGQREALAELVVEFSPMLWHVARAYGLDRATGEDVIQTTWLQLLSHLDSLHNPAGLAGWLTTTARREALRRCKENRRELPASDSLSEPAGPDPGLDERLISDERRRVLWESVRRLPERCQKLLRIVAFEHRPHVADVAVVLGIPAGGVGPTRGRCLAKLRNLLAADPRWAGS
ncbi:MAG: RNA polymerase sigma factor [Actinomycetes bacterium]|jgi:RNA polymerase sigma factor (sigma-70 family)|nr:sigma-70 family RNA polymerase sigma factor [Actinomycetes bacterium]